MSTRSSPASAIRAAAAASTFSRTAADTKAAPRSMDTTAFMPLRSKEPSPASHPSTRGRLEGGYSLAPLHTSYQRAASRTDRDRQPMTAVSGSISVWGPLGMRPNVALRPSSPVKPAGMRMDPPPSPPVQMGNRPPETEAAEPPDEPPGVRSRSYGLEVAPCSRV